MSYDVRNTTAREQGLCKRWSCCGLDEPLANYTADHVDTDRFVGVAYEPYDPLINENWQKMGCMGWCTSEVSQEEADKCASEQAKLCSYPDEDGDGDGDGHFNAEASCSVPCSGGDFTVTVEGGQFLERTQAEADARAAALCAERARQNLTCITDDTPNGCVGVPYYGTVTVEGITPVMWELEYGIYPPGVVLDTGTPTARHGVFTGTPFLQGVYVFGLKVTDANGYTSTQQIRIVILEIITPDPLPSATVGVPYNLQLEVQGGSGLYTFSIQSGSLPAGLTLSAGGLISGTPTGAGSFSAVIQACDNAEEE